MFLGCATTQQTPVSDASPMEAEVQDVQTADKYGGLIYGEDHAYFLTEPDGWILDNQIGVSQGIHAVFYPEGTSWKDSDAVMYSRAVARPEGEEPIQAQVTNTIDVFKANGSPDSRAEFRKTITTDSGETGEIYYFTGDQWNNFEAVAYFPAPQTINFVVLTCRSREAFERSLPAFETVAESYRFVTDNVQLPGHVAPESEAGQVTTAKQRMTTAEGQSLREQTNERPVPKEIVYIPVDDATNARFRKRLETVFAPDYSGNDLIFGETIICGPFLWKAILRAKAMDADTGIPVKMVIPQGEKVIELQARGIKPRAAIDTFERYLRALLAEDGGFTVRKLNPDEMSIYWAMIPYDIEEPVFILESRNHLIIMDFAEDTILHVDDYQNITLRE